MKSALQKLFFIFIVGLAMVPTARATDKIPNAQLRAAGKLGARLYRKFKKPGTRRIQPGVMARVKGNMYLNFPVLKTRPVNLSQRWQQENTDPTFLGTHPMFLRLMKSGWYTKSQEIEGLQRQADQLRDTRQIAPSTPLSEVKFLALDLEANKSSRYMGHYNRHRKRFFSSSNELTQLGYTIYQGGKPIESGSIDFRPDGAIDPKVQQFNGLTPKTLAGAPRFEHKAGEILSLLKGKVWIGQGLKRRDYVWLKSNFARLGVDLPGPRKLMLDTHIMSYNNPDGAMGLKALTQKYGTKIQDHHHARADSRTVGDLFFAMMKKEGITTLEQAEAFQSQGLQKMRSSSKKKK